MAKSVLLTGRFKIVLPAVQRGFCFLALSVRPRVWWDRKLIASGAVEASGHGLWARTVHWA